MDILVNKKIAEAHYLKLYKNYDNLFKKVFILKKF